MMRSTFSRFLALVFVVLVTVAPEASSLYDLPTVANAPAAHWANLPPSLPDITMSPWDTRRAEERLAQQILIIRINRALAESWAQQSQQLNEFLEARRTTEYVEQWWRWFRPKRASAPPIDCSPTSIRCVGPGKEYTGTIQTAVNAAAPGDTVIVFDKASSAVYDEPILSASAGLAGLPITIKAEFDCVSNNGTTVVGGVSTPACVTVREVATNDPYYIIRGFEITGQGMTHDTDRLVLLTTGTSNVQFLNNYVHHGSYQNECIGLAGSDMIIRGNRISHCTPLMTVFSTVFATSFNIQAGVNDKLSFSVQGGPAQNITLTAGAARTPAQISAEINAVLITGGTNASNFTGAGACLGGACEQIIIVNSFTRSAASSIEVLPIANNAYATFGMAEGLGELYGWGPAISATVTDLLVDDNHMERVSDYLNPGNSTRVVFRGSTAGPNDEYQSVHIDVVQPGGADQVLIEDLLAIDGNNIQHHLMHNEIASTQYIWRGVRTCRHRGAFFMGTQSGQNYFYAYNNTFWDNALIQPLIGGGQMSSNVASMTRSLGRNNIWKNSTNGVAPVYSFTNGAAATDANYDLWTANTPSLAAQANDVNAEPLVVNAATCDFTPTALSPAVDAGGPLTTVAAADTGTGTTLVLVDARMFQDGWAGVIADAIAVGTVGNVAQIVSINYATGEVTIASSIPRNDGDPVWWYADSRGVRRLYGPAPDIGARERVQ